ncbi:EamA family transporter [Veronia pacifica]|uniref:ABC transporter permease n=1 Tax=Veronia pacifica TaxID=1080227 RepID=A0A1C3E8Z6_9GAMM|nr:EamA family transporter [Veronia pacifica]ODA29696.1 ABC transporter permease [Veronia pacifica]
MSSMLRDLALASLVPMIWGSTYVVTSEWLPEGVPLWSAVFRALPAGLLLLLFCRRLPTGIWWGRALVLGVLNIGAFFYFLFLAAYSMPGGIAALLLSSQPLWVLLFSAVLFRQSFTPMHFVACALGCLGVAGLVLKSDAVLNTQGVIASVMGAVSMALGVVLAKQWGKPEGVSLLDITGWQLTIGGVVLVPLAIWWEPFPINMTAENYLGLGYLCLIGALLTYIIWFRSIQRLPAFVVSVISLFSPLSATFLGYLVLGEHLNAEQGAGAALIIAAMLLAQRAAGQTTQPVTQHHLPSNTRDRQPL